MEKFVGESKTLGNGTVYSWVTKGEMLRKEEMLQKESRMRKKNFFQKGIPERDNSRGSSSHRLFYRRLP